MILNCCAIRSKDQPALKISYVTESSNLIDIDNFGPKLTNHTVKLLEFSVSMDANPYARNHNHSSIQSLHIADLTL